MTAVDLDTVARVLRVSTDEELHAVLGRMDDQIEDAMWQFVAQSHAIADGDAHLEAELTTSIAAMSRARLRLLALYRQAEDRLGGEQS